MTDIRTVEELKTTVTAFSEEHNNSAIIIDHVSEDSDDVFDVTFLGNNYGWISRAELTSIKKLIETSLRIQAKGVSTK